MRWHAGQQIAVYRERAFRIELALAPVVVVAACAPLVGAAIALVDWHGVAMSVGPFAIALASGLFVVHYIRFVLFLRGLRRLVVSVEPDELQINGPGGLSRQIGFSSISEMRMTQSALILCWSAHGAPQHDVLKYPRQWQPGLSLWLQQEIRRRAGLVNRSTSWRLLAGGWEIAYRRPNGPESPVGIPMAEREMEQSVRWGPGQKIMLYRTGAFRIDLALSPLAVLVLSLGTAAAISRLMYSRSVGETFVLSAVVLVSILLLAYYIRYVLVLRGLRDVAISVDASGLSLWDHGQLERRVGWTNIRDARTTQSELVVRWSDGQKLQSIGIRYPVMWQAGLYSWLLEQMAYHGVPLGERDED